jgi:hypothetical protein
MLVSGIQRVSNHWWFGVTVRAATAVSKVSSNEVKGLFPASCVRLLDKEIVAVGTFAFDPPRTSRTQLGFAAGESLILLSKVRGYQWWYAINEAGQLGRVPESHFRVVMNADEYARADAAASVPTDTLAPAAVPAAPLRTPEPPGLDEALSVVSWTTDPATGTMSITATRPALLATVQHLLDRTPARADLGDFRGSSWATLEEVVSAGGTGGTCCPLPPYPNLLADLEAGVMTLAAKA